MDKRKVELIFGIDLNSFDADRQELERKHQDTLQKMQAGIDVGTSMSGVFPPTPSPSASHDALQGALGAAGDNVPWQELINAVRNLTEITSQSAETSRKANETAQRNLAWQQANALLNLGNQTVNQVAQGNFFGAAGGAIGGLLGLPFGPAGMAAGASIGGMAGNFLQGLSTGAGGARAYTADATDLARRFGGIDQLSPLQDYGLGSEQGYKAEETLSQMGRLQATRIAGSAGEAAELVPAIQQLTRALGLNAEATIDLYQGYVQTGGDRGGAEFRDYMAQVVGGAISAGFESNIQMYGELMNSARTQSVAQSGSLMSDRAFGQLQGILANLTGTDSRASRLFRENPQFAQAGMNTYLSMGGAGDPYSTQAGYLRLAGVAEHQIDRRFTNQETQMANAGKAMDFLGDQMMQYSGMSREQFQAAADADPNFVRSQMAGNVNLQRLMGTQLLPGLIGRDATAQDMRAFEQLSNIAIANGGALPTGTADGAGQVDKLLAQLNMSPADQARQAEAERHNKQLEVMANFQNLMTKTDEWMANIYGWISENLDLAAIEETILSVMDRFGTFVGETAIPFITDQAIPFVQQGLEAAQSLAQWAKDNNIAERLGALGSAAGDAIGGIKNSAVGQVIQDANLGPLDFIGGPIGAFNVTRKLGRAIHGRFNDTPGDGVTAQPGYNTFQFAEGDQVFAVQGGGNTLGDLLQALENLLGLGTEYTELTKELHEEKQTLATEQFDVLALSGEHHAQITEYQAEQTEKIFPLMEAHLGAIADAVNLMPSVDQSLRDLIGVTVDIATMVNTLQSNGGGGMMGAAMGGGSGVAQFPIRGMTLDDARITSGFGWRNIFGRRDFHEGIDIGVSGGTDVLAARSGVVSQIKPLADQLQIAVESMDEQGRKIEEWYIHTSDSLVEVGDRVTAGQKIAEVASTTAAARAAQVSTGDHLDYRVTVDGDWVDPMTMLKGLPAGGTAPRSMPNGVMPEGLTVKGQAISSDQFSIAQRIYQHGSELGASDDEIRAAIATAIQESTLTNLSGGDRDSLGIFQQRPSMEWGSRGQIQDLDFAIESFFEGRGSNPGMIDNRGRAGGDAYYQSHLTQRSAHPDAPRQWDQEAQNLMNAFQGNSRVARNNASAYVPPWERSGGGPDGGTRGSSTGGPVTLNITVNVNGAGSNARQEAYEGATAAVDEFERQWRSGSSRSQPESASDYSYS
ncbi:M23 family metallopeptidase [Leptothoe spongobia]|uniref:M23 family metallopeptidase n=1 Tax=Leptothoe spongobia TAU-MAC 1115 TaxID=1967444 RepID=A0A947GJU8_9CYAN|nr:M23 family metallopeptidase [Leptothoe spongobia]MBT9316288.1 M23 family metallopeptidase [Leptothoe spongobia TAU-MAC 1115]